MDDADSRGLLILFEAEPTLALLETWWIEVPTISALGRTYRGVTSETFFFDWLLSEKVDLLGLELFLPDALPMRDEPGLPATVGSWIDLGSSQSEANIWLDPARRGEEHLESSILQDFAGAFYHSRQGDWALVVNIDWLPKLTSKRLEDLPVRWVWADCDLDFAGGSSLSIDFSAEALYGLRSFFRASEAVEDVKRRIAALDRPRPSLWARLLVVLR